MSALSAAEQILREADSPLSYREISRLGLERGYWSSTGKTPWATVAAQLYTDIRKRGTVSRFIQTGPETFALNPAPALTPSAMIVSKAKKSNVTKLSFTAAPRESLPLTGRKSRCIIGRSRAELSQWACSTPKARRPKRRCMPKF